VLRLLVPPTTAATSGNIFFNYGHTGHFTQQRTAPKKNTTQGHVSHPPRGHQKVVIAKTGHIKYTTMEDVPEGEQVLTGMFALNGYPVVILFDSGASHYFISKACTKKCQLTITHLSTPYMNSTPRGKIVTKYLAKNTLLNLVERVYKTGLIILDGQGIDVILGMSWMKEFNSLLDIAAHTTQLESLAHGIVVLQFPSSIVTTSALHHTTTQNLEDIPVAREFSDVFPDDLLGMPSERDVEFTIELQPNTTPISKRPYKMTPKEPAELKIQLKELLDKGYIRPNSSPWVVQHYLSRRKINH
jgi:hypothetical protein